jgi:acylphosphatase
MKLKIIITGPKVHDVGYRPWLTEQAMKLSLRGFEVYNDDEGELQTVIALAEADEQRIKRLYNLAKTNQPPLAEVYRVESEDYAEDITPLWQAAAMNTSTQLNKAIPLLLGMNQTLGDMNGKMGQMNEKMDLMLEKQDQTVEGINGLREDLTQNTNKRLEGIEKDMRGVKKKLGIR